MKKGETKRIAIVLILLATLLISVGQALFKLTSDNLEMTIMGTIGNYFLWIALVVFFISGLMLISAFKYGELSTLYPVISTSYVWVILISIFFFKEHVNLLEWVGIGVIIVGVILVGVGSKNGS
jgi:drug/metabolite transporter (DMT)-like permease